MIKYFATLTFCLLLLPTKAQELNATVDVITDGIQETNKEIFDELKDIIFNFLNNNIWTDDKYDIEERINCGFVFNITNFENRNTFAADLTVVYSRPIFNTSYNSPVINTRDVNVRFTWRQGERLEYVENQHLSNLSAILAFYVHIIIGMDRDTYSLKGGAPFYAKAQGIVNNAQNDPQGVGWRSNDGNRTRFWLADNLVSPSFEKFSECLYFYHRLGLDLMHDDKRQGEGKENILSGLMGLDDVHKNRPNSYLMQVFMDSKGDEVMSIFGGGATVNVEPLKVLMKKLDPKNASTFDNLGVPSR